MVNIGIDFGSTYTMVSVYADGDLKTVQPNNLAYSYPSIAVYDNKSGKYYFGTAARSKLGKRGCVGYRGFKMLLNQQMSAENLAERKYDEVNTPEHITELFLRYVVENTLQNLGEDRVGTLVLGAPECWFQSLETIDARGTLREICSRMKDIINEVRIVSEPTNAAAFCVWNYENRNHTEYDGNILVVDYGGGTLDTALVSVRHINGKLQIKPEMRSGAGENRDREIGKAGIAYQEAVLKKAICEALETDEPEYGSEFDKALKEFEEELLANAEDIRETMRSYSLSPDGLRDEIFTELDYGGESVPINFYQMYSAYYEVISPVLQAVLDETTQDLMDMNDLHIALVGGFCNFYLVKKQIYDYFDFGRIAEKEKEMIREAADREKAIAHGAALFADGVMQVCNVAQFSIGIYAEYSDGTIFNQYAINYGQEIHPDTVYFAKADNDGKDDRPDEERACPMFASYIDKFLLKFNKREVKGHPMRPKAAFAEKLRAVKHEPCVTVGFSMDAAERITVHIYNYDSVAGLPEKHPVASITLSTLKDTFENTVLY